jgi:hypothetical protein
MIILRKENTAQIIKFIPRVYAATSLILRNESTNVSITLTPTFVIDSYYLKCTLVLDLVENTFYNLTIKNGSNIIYKDKIFCTNQVIEDFTVNKNQYIENITTNEFKIYE